MIKYIAVRSGFVDIYNRLFLKRLLSRRFPTIIKKLSGDLKRHSLLFDEIQIFESQENIRLLKADKQSASLLGEINEMESELEWLAEQNVVSSIDNFKLDVKTLEREDVKDLLKKRDENFDGLVNTAIRNVNPGGLSNEILINQYLKPLLVGDVLSVRLYAASLASANNASVIPYLPHESYMADFAGSRKEDVVNVVINSLPIPDETTPWEKIIDYRNDPECRKNLIALRRWVRNLSAGNLLAAEIQDEIEYLINQYKQFMNLHQIKANDETFEVFVKTTLDVMNNLFSLKFSNVFEPLFALKKRRTALLEAEMNAPGRELAYIIKARDTFS